MQITAQLLKEAEDFIVRTSRNPLKVSSRRVATREAKEVTVLN